MEHKTASQLEFGGFQSGNGNVIKGEEDNA
jgi:hypothetical protein